MAHDLIPPPSPAGRPEPDSSEKHARRAGGLWAGGAEVGEPDAAGAGAAPPAGRDEDARVATGEDARPGAVAAPVTPAVRSPYRTRFGFVLGALVGVALAAVGLAAVLAADAADRDHDREGWSAWAPSSREGVAAATQIAEHVSPKYRLGDGDQLVAVRASGLEISDPPVKVTVALRTSASGGDVRYLDGNGVLYTLNGLGRNGSIASGEPTKERHLLLRREALELALYTFRYADDVDMVVALLPPRATPEGQPPEPGQALLFRPGDLADRLDVPLGATIPRRTPRPETFPLHGPEGRRVEALTMSNLFQVSLQQSQDATAFMVLQR